MLLFWPFFYLLWGSLCNHEPLTAGDWTKKLLLGTPYHHLHFLFALPGLYFFTPMLAVYTAHASKVEFRVLTIVVVAITLISGAIQEYRNVDFGKGYNLFTRFLPFLGFYLAGYALHNLQLGRRHGPGRGGVPDVHRRLCRGNSLAHATVSRPVLWVLLRQPV